MPKTVDARGQACPQPVLLTRTALQESDAVLTIVDNDTARQNVTRMCRPGRTAGRWHLPEHQQGLSRGAAKAGCADFGARKWSAGACDSERHDGPGR
jgi:hypothetical protein